VAGEWRGSARGTRGFGPAAGPLVPNAVRILALAKWPGRKERSPTPR
jgi:hypothetical protein